MEIEDIFNSQEFHNDSVDVDNDEDTGVDNDVELAEGGDDSPAVEKDPVFEYLKENGIIDVDDEFDYQGTEEDIKRALEITDVKRKDKAIKELLNTLPSEFKPLLEYGLAGGSSVKEFLETYVTPDFESLDLDEEANQELVLRQYWKETSNYSDDKISKLISRIKASGDMKTEAEDTVQELIEIKEEKKLALLERQQTAANEERQRIQAEATKFNQAFDTYKAPKERKDKIQSLFQNSSNGTVKFNEVLSSVKSNYEHLLQLSDLLVDYDPAKGFNLDRFAKKAETDKVKGLRDILEAKTKDTKTQIKGGSTPSSNDNFDFEKFINL